MPSALSHALANPEADLGITLFQPEGRKATLNEAWRTRQDGKALRWFADKLAARDVTSMLAAGL